MSPLRLSFLLAMASVPGVLSAQQSASVPGNWSLSPGDSVRISVWNRPELSGVFIVAPDGSVVHPLYKDVRVGGVPLATAEANVQEFLRGFQDKPQFVFEPLLHVSVVGEVNRPNLYAVPVGTSTAQAVARAGGSTASGRLDHVRILRPGANGAQSQLIVDLQHADAASAASLVRSGDQIIVDRKKSLFHDVLLPVLTVLGSVASIGIFIDRASR